MGKFEYGALALGSLMSASALAAGKGAPALPVATAPTQLQPLAMTALTSGQLNLYSPATTMVPFVPSVAPPAPAPNPASPGQALPASQMNTVFMGGWMNAQDLAAQDDRLYQGVIGPGPNGAPAILNLAPLQWDPSNVGYRPGYVGTGASAAHANDPTVIYDTAKKWYYMFYTALNDAWSVDGVQMTRRNQVGMASSTDGKIWTDRGIVIGQNNGFNGTGAWSPSAVYDVAKDQIYVYYHTGSQNCRNMPLAPNTGTTLPCDGPGTEPPQVLRTTLASDGWTRVDTKRVFNSQQAPVGMMNVDVQYAYGKYWMVGNSGGLNTVLLYLSTDGITFNPYDGKEGVLINGGSRTVLTPHIQVTSTINFNVLFSWGTGAGGATSTHLWQYSLQGPTMAAAAATTGI